MNKIPSLKVKETLSSRERVKRAVNMQPVDRMPIDLGAHPSSGISAFAYWELREKLGLSTDKIEITELIPMLARVDDDVLKRFHCDFMVLKPRSKKVRYWNARSKYNFLIPENVSLVKNDHDDWIVENNGRMRMPKDGFFFDMDNAWWPEIEDRSADELLVDTAKEAERIYKETDYYLIYNELYSFFKQDVEWMCRMITEPEVIFKENKQRLEKEIEYASLLIKSMGKYVQAVSIASDLGTQYGPFVNPALYDDLCAPFVEKFCVFIHENSDLKILMHSCGSIATFIPTLIRCGIDMINPVQISASNMEPAELKKKFGNKMVFWGGGCDTQNVLEKGSEKDIISNVRELVNIFKVNSGFIFNQVHNIMGNVPPHNIITMLDTAYEMSFY
ncbi:MAG: hypothetical protein FIA99_11495 [Ruminiclostridium sp.]|nr:hypothetical protein [Ruminiclostridium sp.]